MLTDFKHEPKYTTCFIIKSNTQIKLHIQQFHSSRSSSNSPMVLHSVAINAIVSADPCKPHITSWERPSRIIDDDQRNVAMQPNAEPITKSTSSEP
jgi:hypothetical protein